MKSCCICGIGLNGNNTTWYRQKNYIHKCNDCVRAEKREQAKRYLAADPEKYKDRSVKYRAKLKEENPVKYTCIQMRASAHKRAKALGVPFNIDVGYLVGIAPKYCPVLGVEIKYGGNEKTKASASLDRIDSLKGYTKGNVQIICNLANLMKSEATMDEQISFARWVISTCEIDLAEKFGKVTK